LLEKASFAQLRLPACRLTVVRLQLSGRVHRVILPR
jgi:hypothetical protein